MEAVKNYRKSDFILDIYGKIAPEYEERFNELLENIGLCFYKLLLILIKPKFVKNIFVHLSNIYVEAHPECHY